MQEMLVTPPLSQATESVPAWGSWNLDGVFMPCRRQEGIALLEIDTLYEW